jgi:hypothetical protein
MGWSSDGLVLAVYSVNTDENAIDTMISWIDRTTGSVVDELESGLVPNSEIELLAAVEGTRKWLGRDQDGYVYLYDSEAQVLTTLQELNWPGSRIVMDLGRVAGGEVVTPGQIIDWSFLPINLTRNTSCR